MIILKEMWWDNCFSYGEGNYINLEASNVTQLVGTNGNGKSSIPLILEEVLYNKNSKGFKKADIPNRYINDGYSIRLLFSVNETEYEINVIRKGSIKVTFKEVDGKDLTSHTATNTYKSVEAMLGVDFKTFTQLVLQSTISGLTILTATDTVRKKFIIDLFNLTSYTEMFEVYKSAAKDISEDIKSLEGEIKTLKSWLLRNKLDGTTVQESIIIPNSPEREEKALRSLLVQIENISEKNKNIAQNNKYRELLEHIDITELQNEDLALEDTSELEKMLAETKAHLTIAKRDIKSNKDAPDTCRVCGQSIDNSKAIEILECAEIDKATCEEVISELEPSIKELQRRNMTRKAYSKKITEWENLYTKVDQDLVVELIQPGDLAKDIKKLDDSIKTIKNSIKNALAENAIRDKHNSRLVFIQEQIEDFIANLKIAINKIEISLELSGRLETLKKAFSTNGLVAYKIENLVKDLEVLTNEYLGELADGRFAIEFVIQKDKLNVEITDDGRIVEVTALSSGELARVNVGTLLAIRKLMSSISKSKINVLFLDEAVSVLDDEGKEKLVEVLLQEQELNTFVVSHGWQHPLLDKIEVVKENKISRLE